MRGWVKSKPHPLCMCRAMAFQFRSEAMVTTSLDAQVGEHLQCRRETGNPHDISTVASLKSGVVVGHIPKKISAMCTVAGGGGTKFELIVRG